MNILYLKKIIIIWVLLFAFNGISSTTPVDKTSSELPFYVCVDVDLDFILNHRYLFEDSLTINVNLDGLKRREHRSQTVHVCDANKLFLFEFNVHQGTYTISVQEQFTRRFEESKIYDFIVNGNDTCKVMLYPTELCVVTVSEEEQFTLFGSLEKTVIENVRQLDVNPEILKQVVNNNNEATFLYWHKFNTAFLIRLARCLDYNQPNCISPIFPVIVRRVRAETSTGGEKVIDEYPYYISIKAEIWNNGGTQ